MKRLITNIEKQENVRQALSSLRSMIKDEDQKEEFYTVLTTQPELFLNTLSSEDAKTRKNIAL
ncbi:MAG: methylase, partial [Lachnospiraceae bacterium]|nr:methylase [Lachnospiraceae bacterium]